MLLLCLAEAHATCNRLQGCSDRLLGLLPATLPDFAVGRVGRPARGTSVEPHCTWRAREKWAILALTCSAVMVGSQPMSSLHRSGLQAVQNLVSDQPRAIGIDRADAPLDLLCEDDEAD